jgi:hypothetical protein
VWIGRDIFLKNAALLETAFQKAKEQHPDTIQDETRSPPTPAAADIAAQPVRLRSHLFFRQPIARLGKSFYICGPYQPLILGAKPRPGTSIR